MSHPINTINNEEYAYTLWVREKKNRILNMSDLTKKQEQWNKLFQFRNSQPDDSYLLGGIY